MRIETFNIIKKMNLKALDTQLALQCAPVLMGVKISNLLNISVSDASSVMRIFEGTSIETRILYLSEEKATVFLYRSRELGSYLSLEKTAMLFQAFAYSSLKIEDIMEQLIERYTCYRQNGGCFPHEIGLLLGYPAEDVLAFIVNGGKNFLYSGYWKVYSNLSDAVRTFEIYEQAKEIAIRLVADGGNILELLNLNPAQTTLHPFPVISQHCS